ncbi:sigma factor [Sphaerisporangium fuscum]|uniref:sigma factor n=1 Tax=Sphaerisporangium fuscum TaxID=2835868 RepID=UPI001BDDB47B|nr:sigma factor [Sphaerisporangium fuscum]
MTTPSRPGHGRPDPGLDAIMSERRQLINIAYRLLGSLAEAEDAVQETCRIRASQPSATPATQRAGIIRDFKQAWEAKDIEALIGLLDPDATAIADGGGLAVTFLHPIEGGEQIARAWIEIAERRPGDMTYLECTVNGQPGLVAQQDGVTVTVFAFEVEDDRIKHIWVVRNPEKLRRWTAG